MHYSTFQNSSIFFLVSSKVLKPESAKFRNMDFSKFQKLLKPYDTKTSSYNLGVRKSIFLGPNLYKFYTKWQNLLEHNSTTQKFSSFLEELQPISFTPGNLISHMKTFLPRNSFFSRLLLLEF